MSTWAVKTKKKLDLVTLTWISRVIAFFAACAPYRVGVASGAAFGLAAYYLLPRERKRTLTHLAFVYPQQTRSGLRRLARGCFMHLGKALLETMLITSSRLRRIVDIKGEENLRNALSRGKGVVFVGAHIGNWEMLAHVVASLSSLSVVAAPIKPERVNDMIVGLRARMGVRTILRGKPGASRELIRTFRENRVLGILIDQDTDVEGAFVDFMGRPSWTPTAAASMAIKFGAPLVFGSICRRADGRHTVTIEGPLPLARTEDDEKDIVANTGMLSKKIEKCIMENPEQWVWMHRRWRRQP